MEKIRSKLLEFNKEHTNYGFNSSGFIYWKKITHINSSLFKENQSM